MTEGTTSRRIPWAAAALSLLSPGIGHLYCGRIFRGLLFYFAWFLVPVLCFVASLCAPSTLALVSLILLPAALLLGVYVYAAIDAFVIARRDGSGYLLKDYNRPGVYGLLLIAYLMCPITLVTAVRAFAFEAFYIPTSSMSPSIIAGDRVLANKMRVRKRYPERGELVVFRNPELPGAQQFIKRVVGLAGDRIVVRGDEIEINGRALERDPLPLESFGAIQDRIQGDAFYEMNSGRRYQVIYDQQQATDSEMESEFIVPPRAVFVLGDNRNVSRDSRHFGAIHLGDVVGYVDYIYYPAGDWSRFGNCNL